MKKLLNKAISTPLAIGIILALSILVGGITVCQYREMNNEIIASLNVQKVFMPVGNEKPSPVEVFEEDKEEAIELIKPAVD